MKRTQRDRVSSSVIWGILFPVPALPTSLIMFKCVARGQGRHWGGEREEMGGVRKTSPWLWPPPEFMVITGDEGGTGVRTGTESPHKPNSGSKQEMSGRTDRTSCGPVGKMWPLRWSTRHAVARMEPCRQALEPCVRTWRCSGFLPPSPGCPKAQGFLRLSPSLVCDSVALLRQRLEM